MERGGWKGWRGGVGIHIGMRVRCRYRIGPYIDYIIMCGCSLRKARISPYTLSSPSLPSLTLSVSYILNLPISPQIFVITALILHSSLSLCSLTLSLPSLFPHSLPLSRSTSGGRLHRLGPRAHLLLDVQHTVRHVRLVPPDPDLARAGDRIG